MLIILLNLLGKIYINTPWIRIHVKPMADVDPDPHYTEMYADAKHCFLIQISI